MSKQLEKIIELARKTGDRIIVFDPRKENKPYVVMPLDEYEKIIIGKNDVRGLTEDELLDKINRDIAIWKSEQDFQDNNFEDNTSVENDLREDDLEDFENDFLKFEKEKSDKENKEPRLKRKKRWSIPKTRLEAAKEVLREYEESRQEEPDDEDTQYLEEITF